MLIQWASHVSLIDCCFVIRHVSLLDVYSHISSLMCSHRLSRYILSFSLCTVAYVVHGSLFLSLYLGIDYLNTNTVGICESLLSLSLSALSLFLYVCDEEHLLSVVSEASTLWRSHFLRESVENVYICTHTENTHTYTHLEVYVCPIQFSMVVWEWERERELQYLCVCVYWCSPREVCLCVRMDMINSVLSVLVYVYVYMCLFTFVYYMIYEIII